MKLPSLAHRDVGYPAQSKLTVPDNPYLDAWLEASTASPGGAVPSYRPTRRTRPCPGQDGRQV